MSAQERTLRWLLLGALWSLPVWPVLIVLGLWWADPAPILAALAALGYLLWRLDHSSTGTWVSTYLGSGVAANDGTKPCWSCRPYLVVGRAFRARLADRERLARLSRIVELERDLDLHDTRFPSAWAADYERAKRSPR